MAGNVPDRDLRVVALAGLFCLEAVFGLTGFNSSSSGLISSISGLLDRDRFGIWMIAV